ncbi:50S ribosomal protein L23 [Candidatus Shapirobacteria bacterium CG09_land_8_20_14_0_10_39_12]|uniref:50S ribosomal protein L23 n=1 Tax=Candidatus Shapirobacteria bacterium CG09_land_8_20_14_0_10_39_12 TaxID=1974885 RepID=A0A2H0WRA8_9BACT|nr:MAG: 50S ribosomal protein L23 [Candidatus Shapirobacteria bacterium CG09_land_8_20_14_0_10_39_12]
MEVNKDLLKEMLKKSFKVDILAIKTAVVKGKRKRNPTSRRMRKQSDWKKVFIKVKEGQKIALFDVGA